MSENGRRSGAAIRVRRDGPIDVRGMVRALRGYRSALPPSRRLGGVTCWERTKMLLRATARAVWTASSVAAASSTGGWWWKKSICARGGGIPVSRPRSRGSSRGARDSCRRHGRGNGASRGRVPGGSGDDAPDGRSRRRRGAPPERRESRCDGRASARASFGGARSSGVFNNVRARVASRVVGRVGKRGPEVDRVFGTRGGPDEREDVTSEAYLGHGAQSRERAPSRVGARNSARRGGYSPSDKCARNRKK
jgi:hypothetical protein